MFTVLTRIAIQIAVATLGLSLGACSTKGRTGFADIGDGSGVVTVADRCATPDEGCACPTAGEVVDCGHVIKRIDDYVTCAMGSRTCNANAWSACAVSSTQTQSVPTSNRYRLQSLGGSQSCVTNDPCDPYCNRFTDTPVNLDAGTGLTANDAGVALSGTQAVVSSICTGLSISPTPQTLTVTQFSPASPNTLTFTANFTPMGCAPAGTQPLWGIDRYDIATINASGVLTLVTPNATSIQVSAYAGTLTATATANISVAILDTTTGPAPTGTGSSFSTTTGVAETDLKILYPYAQTVLPLGLPSPLLQWSSATAATGANSAVKVSVRWPVGGTGTPSFKWSAIVPENMAIFLDPPTNAVPLAAGKRRDILQAVWAAFEQSAKGQDAEVVVQRLVNGTLRGEVASSIHFATNQLKGKVFYQSYGTNLVQNYSTTWSPQTYARSDRRFGAATLAIKVGQSYPTATAGFTSASDGPGCRVCHSASADGSALVTNNFPSDFVSSKFSNLSGTPTETLITGTNDGRYAWPAVYKDGSFIFSNAGPLRSTTAPGGLQGGDNGTQASALYSIPSGAALTSSGIPSGLKAALPSFSADGTHVVFNHYAGGAIAPVTGATPTVTGDMRSIGMADFNASSTPKAFSNFRRLVTQSSSVCSAAFGSIDPCTNVWPSFLPGNEGVVFEKEIFNNGRVIGANHSDFGGTRSGCDDGSGAATCGNDGAKAELWWVSTGLSTPSATTPTSTPTATRLNAANGLDSSGTLTIPTGTSPHTASIEPVLNYEPTLNPTATGGYYWVVFTSRRLYGNVATMNPWWSDPRFRKLGGELGATTKKLWVSAVKSSPVAGQDPSYPAFYLPGQELLAGNSRGYWVLDQCKSPSATRTTANECETTLDCCQSPTPSSCTLQTPVVDPPKRHCTPLAASICIADGASTCATHADCCNFASGTRCASGTCALPPPVTLYSTATFTRDFTATCPSDTKPVWQLFEWQAVLPAGTSMTIKARSTDDASLLATATPLVTVATVLPPSTTGWTGSTSTVDALLKSASWASRSYLRVEMTMNPSSDRYYTPSLTNWRITYDCPPVE
jgi:hypothetical protein